jgi:ABC-2 type transport system ATP-binding protein
VLAVECTGLTKSYGDVVAVDGLDLTIPRGEIFGLLGPNGAGKTTTIEILEGLLSPDAGRVSVLGMRWGADNRALRQRLGIQLQEAQLNEKLTVIETLRLFRAFYHHGAEIDDVLAEVELESKRTALVGKLSGGQRQRLSVACALVGLPDLLFLDEPTTGLDPQSRRQLWTILERFNSRGGTILLTTHYMEEAASLCHRVAIVDRGKVIALDAPASLVRSLGAEYIVEFAVDGAEIGVEALGRLAGVIEARREEKTYAVTTSITHQAVPALLSLITQSGGHLSLLNTHRATLEDVFMALTGRHLRDD